jgi:hypothetical protein
MAGSPPFLASEIGTTGPRGDGPGEHATRTAARRRRPAQEYVPRPAAVRPALVPPGAAGRAGGHAGAAGRSQGRAPRRPPRPEAARLAGSGARVAPRLSISTASSTRPLRP